MSKLENNAVSASRLEEAAQWHARMSADNVAEADWLALTDWLEADGINRFAYDQVEDMLNLIEAEAQTIEENITTQENNTVIQSARRWSQPKAWAGAVTAIAATFFLMISGVFNAPDPITYQTGFGETKLVSLEDGSTIQLNANSLLTVAYSKKMRQTELAFGEAFFTVAKNSERPFRVKLNKQSVQVVGTQFNILRHDARIVVTVSEGLVDVAPTDIIATSMPNDQKQRLGVDDQLIYNDLAATTIVQKVDARRITSWQHGYLEYEAASLNLLAQDISRFIGMPVTLEENAQNISFSGTLYLSDQDTIWQTMEQLLPVTIEKSDNAFVIRRKE